MICGVLAAVAGVLNTARLGASDPSFVGLLIELSAITAVVVGGTPLSGGRVRILGTLAGALLMQLIIATLIQHNLPDSTARMVQAAIIVAAVYIQRDGARHDATVGPIPTRQSSRGPSPRRLAAGGRRPVARRAVVLVLVLVAGTAGPSATASPAGSNFRNIALDSSYLLLIAIGMTFVIISGGIDLSVGSLLALAGVLTAYGSQWGIVVAVALPLAVCGVIGLVNGLLIGRARMAPFIVTLAALLFARGLAFAVADEGNKIYIIQADLPLTRLGQARCSGVGAPVWFALVAVRCSAWWCSTAPGSARPCSPSAAARRRPS